MGSGTWWESRECVIPKGGTPIGALSHDGVRPAPQFGTHQIREWAIRNSHKVSTRGRLHRDHIEAYSNANKRLQTKSASPPRGAWTQRSGPLRLYSSPPRAAASDASEAVDPRTRTTGCILYRAFALSLGDPRCRGGNAPVNRGMSRSDELLESRCPGSKAWHLLPIVTASLSTPRALERGLGILM